MRFIALLSLLSGVVLFSTACATTKSQAAPPEAAAFPVEEFAREVAQKHGLDAAELRKLLSEAQHQQSIIDAMTRPAEKLPWHRYRPIFLKPDRIAAGVTFWQENDALLAKLSEQYGVAPEVLVAIVGVETFYGRLKGKYRVLDALATLGFNYPPRASFFRSELEQFILLSREEGMDPLAALGSYAGAMGMPQFIPSSYRNFAVDGDGDGKRNLFDDRADILASVANYFQRHGWQAGAPVAFPATVEGEAWQPLVSNDLDLNSTVGQLAQAGVKVDAKLPADTRAKLVVLEGEAGDERWLALNNFYVITRYNRSPLYAMAVFQLAEAIRGQREAAR